ncbi:hypothetical protein G6011_06276 [Alternaria panax]|uniref:Uncharacterized protein n=1 Tax=Alternaria panax TaxID=48097 RepID=A0AAD4FI60_9PLEO|nr:hypothetical protein G6011_06276 [Alternaria panax]
MPSCRGKEFNEVAKSKDHFKQVHGLSREFLEANLNFKLKAYTGCQSLEEKWKKIFHSLFPPMDWHLIPTPYANEEADSDALIFEAAKATASELNIDITEENINNIIRCVKGVHFARSTSVDSAVEFENEDVRVVKEDEPRTPSLRSHEGSSRITFDEAYSEPSPEFATKPIRKPDAHAHPTALPLSYPWSFGAGLTVANGGAPDPGLQPSQAIVSAAHTTLLENDSYFDLSHEHTPHPSPNIDTASEPFTSQGYASPHLNTSPFAVSSHQTNDGHVYHDLTIAPTAIYEHPGYLSKESSELLPATRPSLEEQSQVWTSSVPSEYLKGLDGDHDTED